MCTNRFLGRKIRREYWRIF